MDMTSGTNFVQLCGSMGGRPVFSHSSRNQEFYTFPLEVQRLSGNIDTLNIIIRSRQLADIEAEPRSKLKITGELRSFNNRCGQGAKLVITVFAKELYFCEDEDMNAVHLKGTLCREPKLRCTPTGKDICDLMLAVNRRYGRSDYLPCICWGQNAGTASLWTTGTEIVLNGRIQSRDYIKLTDSGPLEKTAYEVSAAEINELAAEYF